VIKRKRIKDNDNFLSLKDIAHKEKIKVALISIIASAILTISKLIIATLTNSLGILSEGMHSGLDVIAATMTLYAVRMARRPPDLEHNYGYAKFESLTSLGEIILLLIIAGWIFYEGVERIFFIHIVPEITIFSFVVIISSILVDFGRSRALYRIANKYGSQALEADALHFKVDMFTSAIVLAGLTVVYLFKIPNADAYAALIVAGLIIYTSLGLGRRTLDVLLDKAPKGIQSQILESIKGFEGVKKAHDIRVRKVGGETFVDLHIDVPRVFTHDKAHRIATNVENKIRHELLPNSDVVVHVDAVEDAFEETLKDKIRLIAADFPSIKNIHSLYLSKIVASDLNPNSNPNSNEKHQSEYQNDKKPSSSLHIYLDIQMDNTLNFKTAHDIIDEFEKKIKEKIPNINRITTHIETESDTEVSIGHEEYIDRELLEKIKSLVLSVDGVSECKDIALVKIDNDLHITLTIKINHHAYKKDEDKVNELSYIQEHEEENKGIINNNLSVEKAHQISTLVQNLILKNTQAARVVVHAEPD
jgi:cation diffusion facilitator family transporter